MGSVCHARATPPNDDARINRACARPQLARAVWTAGPWHRHSSEPMRIACPSCAAEYEVPDAALAAGPRTLRCARCAHQFQAALPAPESPPEPPAPQPAAPEPAAAPPAESLTPDRPPPSRGPTQSMPIDPPLPRLSDAPTSPPDRMALAGWLVTVAVLAVGVYAGLAFRAEIMGAWPASARLYQALGLG